VPLAVAQTAHLRLASAAAGHLSAVLARDVLGLDPFPAAPRGAVDSIPRREFPELLVPRPLEVGVQQLLDVLERYDVCRATLGRHVLRIGNGEFEAPLEARVTHPVAALEPGRFGGWQVVHTYDTLDAAVAG